MRFYIISLKQPMAHLIEFSEEKDSRPLSNYMP